MQIKTSNKKTIIKLSKKEWIQIGKQSGWIKISQEDQNEKYQREIEFYKNLSSNPSKYNYFKVELNGLFKMCINYIDAQYTLNEIIKEIKNNKIEWMNENESQKNFYIEKINELLKIAEDNGLHDIGDHRIDSLIQSQNEPQLSNYLKGNNNAN